MEQNFSFHCFFFLFYNIFSYYNRLLCILPSLLSMLVDSVLFIKGRECGGVVIKKQTTQTKEHSQQSNANRNTFIYQQVHCKKYYECSKYSLSNICVCVWERERLLSRCMQVD